MLGFLPSSGFQRSPRTSRVSVAPAGFGQALPPVIFEFLGSANSTISLPFVIPRWCASTRPGISRFRVRCFASPRNDGLLLVHPRLRRNVLHVVGHGVVVH